MKSKFCDPPLQPSFSTIILQLHSASSGCFGPPRLYRWRAGLAAPPGGGNMFSWDVFWPCLAGADHLRHTLSRQVCPGVPGVPGVPGLLPSEISRVLPAALPCSALSCAGGTRSLNRNQLQTPTTDTCVWGLCLSATWPSWATTALTLLSYCSPGTAFHATHETSKWCFLLACRVCLSSVWQNKKIRNRSEWEKKWQNRKIQINARDRASQSATMQNPNMQHHWSLDPVKGIRHTWEPSLLYSQGKKTFSINWFSNFLLLKMCLVLN